MYGAKLSGLPFIHSTARIQIPWHLTMKHRSCIGERSNLYSLGNIEIHEGATIAQDAALRPASHDGKKSSFQLLTSKITIEKNAFIGVRAMILPGVKIGENAVIGAMSVVTRNVSKNETIGGNPAKPIKHSGY